MSWRLPEGGVLGVFAKWPEPGKVKTRLAEVIGPEDAADVHRTILLDLLDQWADAEGLDTKSRRVLVFAPNDAGPRFDTIVPSRFALQPQVEGNLGTRLEAFFEGEFQEGASKVVAIGSDSPTLDPSFVLSAFLCLDQKHVVIGPAFDGGYYLIGSRNPLPPIFRGIDWSTSCVLTQTVERLEESGRSLALLPPWYDIDTIDDWRMLDGHLRALRLSGLDPRLPRVEAYLREHPTSMRQ